MMDETTTPTLAPCPCGKPAHIRPAPTPGYGGRYWGSCRSYMCQISGPVCDNPEDAAAAWNSLAADVQRGKVAAKMAESLKEIVAELRKVPAMQARKYDGLGIKTLDALREYDALTTEAAK